MTAAGEERPDAEELHAEQAEKEHSEATRAREAASEQEADQHARRAEKSAYLKDKLAERARSERED